jgi:hypothetical protein
MRRLLLLLLSLLLVFAAPVAAPAATVSLREDPPDKYDTGAAFVTFTAGAGERNLTSVTRDGASFVVRNGGGPLTPSGGCVAIDAQSARCSSVYPIQSMQADLGDLDDAFTGPADPTAYLSLVVLGGEAPTRSRARARSAGGGAGRPHRQRGVRHPARRSRR